MTLLHSFGKERETFFPPSENIIILSVLGLAGAAGGIAIAIFIFRSDAFQQNGGIDRVTAIIAMGLAGLGGPLSGIPILNWMWKLAKHRVTVFEEGFEYKYGNEVAACRWSDIDHIDELFKKEDPKVSGAQLKNVYRGFIVHRNDGKRFTFSAMSLDRLAALASYLEEARDKRGVRWEVVEQ